MMILEKKIIHGHVLNVGISTNNLKLRQDTTVTVEKLKIHHKTLGLSHIPVAKFVTKNLSLYVDTSVFFYAILVPAHLVQRWSL